MKKIFTTLSIITISASVFAQDPIENYSFENWITNAKSQLIPTGWYFDSEDIDSNALRKHTSGSHGNAALYLGSYNNSSLGLVGAEIYLDEFLINIPASLSFDYIVQNNTTKTANGLGVDIFFYDSIGKEIGAYYWGIANLQNNANFKRGYINFNTDSIAKAKKYELYIYYNNNEGKIDEYAIVDNFKFGNTAANVGINNVLPPAISLYPNPTAGVINYLLPANQTASKITVTGIDGKETTFTPYFANTVDISSLPAGVYTLSFLNEQNIVVGRNKIVLIK